MPECKQCEKQVDLPFKCKFCGGYFCLEHRFPENHNCPNIPPKTPLGSYQTKRMWIASAIKTEKIQKSHITQILKLKTYDNTYGYHFEVPIEVYSNEKYKKKLDVATTLDEVESIIQDYYCEHSKEKTERPERGKPFPTKKALGLILLSILIISLVFYVPSVLDFARIPLLQQQTPQQNILHRFFGV